MVKWLDMVYIYTFFYRFYATTMGKTYHILPEWFKRTDELGHKISTWCKKLDDKEVFCSICNKKIYCGSKGFAALTQHVATNIHKENSSVKLDSCQLLFQRNIENHASSSKTANHDKPKLDMICKRETVTRAEIIWALKSVQCNMAAGVSDDLKDVFSAMFSGNIAAENFHLGRTKLTYFITEALSPYFRKELLNDARKSYYTLLFDETTNFGDKKELQFKLKFWSEALQEVICRHLQTVFLGHATADHIVEQIENVLNSAGLSFNKLIMLGSDGPNVNKKVWRLVNEKLLDEAGHPLIDIGTCSIHTVHNAFHKGLEEFGDTVCELISDIYHFFNNFPSRWEDYKSIQVKKDVPERRFIKHSSNRWLTLGPACQRLLQQWPAVLEYFSIFLPAQGTKLTQTEKYKRIMRSIRYTDILVEITFVIESSQIYSSFMEYFQRSEPLIHILGSELNNLLQKIAGRICKPDIINVQQSISSEHLRQITTIDCGAQTKSEIAKLKENDRKNVYYKIQKHYIAGYNYILSKGINEKGNLLSHLQCLSAMNMKCVNSIGKIAQTLSFLGVKELNVMDEWRILQAEMTPGFDKMVTRIDHFWRNIITQKTEMGHLKYPSLSKVVKVCLSLSHGNSDVERGFSLSKRILTEDKASMSERLLNDRLIIQDAVKPYPNVAHIPITKELLTLAYGARKSYEIYLEEQKKLKEEKEKIERENEERLREKKRNEERLKNLKGSVDELEKKAELLNKEKKEIQNSVDSLFKNANEKLKLAIQEKDMEGIRIAQAMIEGTAKLRETERNHDDKAQKINAAVNKRKKNLIDSFFNKKPKNF